MDSEATALLPSENLNQPYTFGPTQAWRQEVLTPQEESINKDGESTKMLVTRGTKTEPHINLLEIRAAKEAAINFSEQGDRVRLYLDSKVACCYVRKQGGTRSDLLSWEACQLWEEMEERKVVLLTPHWISSKENVGADFLTRHRLDVWEVMLDPLLFQVILKHFGIQPTLDAFASRETRQLPRYMSWEQDQESVGRDAMMCPWDKVTYIFPPLPLLPKVLNKIKRERILAILICPHWPSSMWWGLLQEMLVENPLPLPPYRTSTRMLDGTLVRVYLDPLQALLVSGRV